jgi:hypothetical protein
MAELPEVTPVNDREYSPAVRQLAERYGMTPESIEQIVSGTATRSDATTPPVAEVAHEPSVAPTNVPVTPPVMERKTSARVPPARAKSGPGLPIAIAIVTLIGLGVALSFKQGCYRQRGSEQAVRPNASDTLQSQQLDAAKQASEPPVQPTPVTPPQVPPEALNVPRESPAGTTGPAGSPSKTTSPTSGTTSGATKPRVRKPVLTTSSTLQAEEHLAELRANGNMRARIVAHGSGAKRTYKVYAR